MGEALGLLGEAARVGLLDGVQDAGVQAPAPVVQQALVGHVVDEGVAEAVHQIGEERALVEEAARVELLEPAPHLLDRHVGHRLEQADRHLVADHGGGLEQALVLVAEPVDAGGDGGAARWPAPPARGWDG